MSADAFEVLTGALNLASQLLMLGLLLMINLA